MIAGCATISSDLLYLCLLSWNYVTDCKAKNFERSYLIKHYLTKHIQGLTITEQYLRILSSSFGEEAFQRFALNMLCSKSFGYYYLIM